MIKNFVTLTPKFFILEFKQDYLNTEKLKKGMQHLDQLSETIESSLTVNECVEVNDVCSNCELNLLIVPEKGKVKLLIWWYLSWIGAFNNTVFDYALSHLGGNTF